MKIDGSFARNIDFEEADFGVHQENLTETVNFVATQCENLRKTQALLRNLRKTLARNARFEAPTCLVLSLCFSCGPALSVSKVSKPVLMSFCVAGMARRDILTCLQISKFGLCGMRDTFARFSEDGLHFSWPGEDFGDLHGNFSWQV